jgi:predicted nuclease of predicted toxin-antitoxin system
MRFKLDENLGSSCRKALEIEHHDVSTVLQQRLSSAIDEHLAEVCKSEGRVLVTMDLDFANILRFPPEKGPGIAVLRPSGKITESALNLLMRTLVAAVRNMEIKGKLWVVEPGRIRVHDSENPER